MRVRLANGAVLVLMSHCLTVSEVPLCYLLVVLGFILVESWALWQRLPILTQKISALSLILWIPSLLSTSDYSGLHFFLFFLVCKTDNSLHMFFNSGPCSGFGVCLHPGLAWSSYFQLVVSYLSMKSYRLGAFQELLLTSFTFLTAFVEFAGSSLLRWWITVVTINIHGFHGPFYLQ